MQLLIDYEPSKHYEEDGRSSDVPATVGVEIYGRVHPPSHGHPAPGVSIGFSEAHEVVELSARFDFAGEEWVVRLVGQLYGDQAADYLASVFRQDEEHEVIIEFVHDEARWREASAGLWDTCQSSTVVPLRKPPSFEEEMSGFIADGLDLSAMLERVQAGLDSLDDEDDDPPPVVVLPALSHTTPNR